MEACKSLTDSIGAIQPSSTQADLPLNPCSQAALINLRTIVFHLGPLHTSIRTSVKQVISLGSGGPGTVGLPAEGVRERACPWFLVSTVALELADRDVCRSALSLGLPMR